MTEVYVVGGQQKKNAQSSKEWSRYSNGLILKLNLDTGDVTSCVSYISPSEVCSENPSIVFKAGTLLNDKLYVATQTEILIYSLPSFELEHYLTHPWLNDVHHVYPTQEETLLVANTGLDQVLEFNLKGEILNQWNTLGENTWERFDQDTDYRLVQTTKPHHSHPNYVFKNGEDIWVTRFQQRDAICLNDPNRRIPIELESPHDGIIHGDSIYYTTINGHVVIADLKTQQVKEVIDLNAIHNINKNLGWTRGLAVLDEEHVLVGFSRIRPTKFKENLKWVRYKMGLTEVAGNLPTRVALYNIKRREICSEYNLEEYHMNAVFSIHP